MKKTKAAKNVWLYYLLPPSILSLITIIVYHGSLRYPFLFDDLPNIVNNYEIRATTPSQLWFSNARWMAKLLNYFTFVNWKLSPFAYRVIDLIMHITAGALIFALVLLLCSKSKKNKFVQKHALLISTLTSALFLLHPVQTQTVTYVTQIRLEGLALLFTLVIMLLFSLAVHSANLWTKIGLGAGCVFLVPFAAGTKEIIVVLPLLLMLIDWFFLAEGDYKVFFKRLPAHLVIAFILYYTYLKVGSPAKPAQVFSLGFKLPNNRGNILTPKAGQLITPLKYMIGQFRVVLHYITMYFWPFGLTFDYGWKINPSFWAPINLLSFLTLISILGTGLYLFIKNQINLISFSIAWFFIVVMPRSSIIPSTEFVCDYKTYIASFGVLFFIAIGLTKLIEKIDLGALIPNRRLAQFVLPLILCVSLGFASNSRNTVWSSRLLFWGDVLKKTEPHTSARAYNNYAVGLQNIGDAKQAMVYYQKSVETDPTYAEPVINIALHYQIKKDYFNALKHYKHAMTLNEPHPEMFNNLGLLHYRREVYDKAEKSFLGAIKLRRHYSKALYNLGRVYLAQNKLEKAREYFKRSVHGDSAETNFYYMYGATSCQAKKYADAIPYLAYLATQSPNFKNTSFLLAMAYYNTNQFRKSVPHFAFVHNKDKTNASGYNYAQALLKSKMYAKALPLFEACRGDNKLPHAPLHITKCLHELGETDKARKELALFLQRAPTPSLKQMGVQLLKEIMV